MGKKSRISREKKGLRKQTKVNMEKQKKTVLTVLLLVFALPVLAFLIPIIVRMGWAEQQQGGSPDSGRTSIIRTLYDELVTLGYGSDAPGVWGDYTAVWNRVFSASIEDRILLYGHLDTQNWNLYGLQRLVGHDDSLIDQLGHENYTKKSSSFWIQIYEDTDGEIWMDGRTGLYWSDVQDASISNDFDMGDCSFFDGARGEYGGEDSDCGDAINFCANLDLAGRSNWYLPSMDEIYQAYLNGIYLRTRDDFTNTNYLWTSTEHSGTSSEGWRLKISSPDSSVATKTGTNSIRCVSPSYMGQSTAMESGGGYFTQSVVSFDDYEDIAKSSSSHWSKVYEHGGDEIWRDERTGLYWTNVQGSAMSNGEAASLCNGLDLHNRTNWYLPSIDELVQAYLDGMYIHTGSSFVVDSGSGIFWSSTEDAGDSNKGWNFALHKGNGSSSEKTDNLYARCVFRD
jgi:hypothetical protein